MWNNKNTKFLTFSYVQNHNFFARIKLLKNAGGKTQDEKSFILYCAIYLIQKQFKEWYYTSTFKLHKQFFFFISLPKMKSKYVAMYTYTRPLS